MQCPTIFSAESLEELIALVKNISSSRPLTIWRGQADSLWRLESSLERSLAWHGSATLSDRVVRCMKIGERSLELALIPALRTALSSKGIPLDFSDEELLNSPEHMNKLLSFGQHYGLYTSLIDFTSRWQVALFFAAESAHFAGSASTNCFALWGISSSEFEQALKPGHKLEITCSKGSYCSERLVAQSGLFAQTFKIGDAATDHWDRFLVRPNEAIDRLKIQQGKEPLVKIEIPSKLKWQVLCWLLEDGVDWRSLFPDIEGLLRHQNLVAQHDSYGSF
ncbi:MAG: FRG domain-containing protein [Chthonomonas sp.]|nr:FRG domain-containing protein [Chthonomonas sp.]